MRPLACGELAGMMRIPNFAHIRPNCVSGSAPWRAPPDSAAAHTRSSNRYRAPGECHTARSTPAAPRRPPRSFPARRSPQTSARRIVDHRQQATLRTALLKPRMKTAIELDQLAKVRFPLAPAPMRTPFPRPTPEARRQHPAPQRVVMHVHAILTGQVLRRQRRPEPLVHRAAVFLANQRQHRARARPPPAPHSNGGRHCDVSGPSRPRPDTGDTTVSPGGSSRAITVAADRNVNVPAATRASTPARVNSVGLIAVRPNPRPPVAA